MRGVQCGTLYKLLGSTINDGCNNSIVPKGENEEEKTPTISVEKLFCGIEDLYILERKGFKFYKVNVWLKVCLIVN